jgi:aconitate hydratase
MATHGELSVNARSYTIIELPAVAGEKLSRLPYIHRILLENVLRMGGSEAARAKAALLGESGGDETASEIPFLPNRVLMHDTTCGPALVDIAGMRAALSEAGGNPALLNPVIPVDVSTDHSLAVDVFAQQGAIERNVKREFERNAERYRFMKWATNTLRGFTAHPPGTGIMHTLNLERLATVVGERAMDGRIWAVPDTLVGTDSHTPMINGIGVLAWGVGGLEAESVMLGLPITLRVPEVVGVRFTGALRSGVLATDLVLTVTERLRRIDLQDRFIEFFGPGVSSLSAGDRAVVANMAPEYGANMGYFPIDVRTIDYLAATGRSRQHVAFVEAYARRAGLWFDAGENPHYSHVVEMDLAHVTVSLAGPLRPHDRIDAGDTRGALRRAFAQHDFAPKTSEPGDGSVAIAAITSCTNTSNPRLLIAAGLLARKARAYGLKPPHWVKTSLAPGSPTAETYLRRAGLLDDLEAVGFGIVGYGCTTCIGNSGPLTEPIAAAIAERDVRPVAVLSGNRNFPGRVHPLLEAGFLASPPLVVAFGLAGTANLDILQDPIGASASGEEVTLSMLWPSSAEIDEALAKAANAEDFSAAYGAAEASHMWRDLEAPQTMLFPWDSASTYIRRPPFASFGSGTLLGRYSAYPLLVVGDDVTTDHISPAGAIPQHGEAGRYLAGQGENPMDLNVFASRRGNWEVMVRGLFTNKTVRNQLGEGILPGSTVHAPTGDVIPLWQAAERYARDAQSVVIVAGERYGMGSSRDWAAKGVSLLGVRAVLARSFERIHRANLIGMGILPIRLLASDGAEGLKVRSGDTITIDASPATIAPRGRTTVTVNKVSGDKIELEAILAVETTAEIETLKAGGILPQILARLLQAG